MTDDLNARHHWLMQNDPVYADELMPHFCSFWRVTDADLRGIHMKKLEWYRKRLGEIAKDIQEDADDTGYLPDCRVLFAEMAERVRAATEVGVVCDSEGRPF